MRYLLNVAIEIVIYTCEEIHQICVSLRDNVFNCLNKIE